MLWLTESLSAPIFNIALYGCFFFFLPCEYILLCHLNADDLNADDLTSQSEIKDLSCTVDDHIPAMLL